MCHTCSIDIKLSVFPFICNIFKILELENLVINPISSMAKEINEIYNELIVEVFQGIELSTVLPKKQSPKKKGHQE